MGDLSAKIERRAVALKADDRTCFKDDPDLANHTYTISAVDGMDESGLVGGDTKDVIDPGNWSVNPSLNIQNPAAGTYTVTANPNSEQGNYYIKQNDSGALTIKGHVSDPVDISGARVEVDPVTYDGKAHALEGTDDPLDGTKVRVVLSDALVDPACYTIEDYTPKTKAGEYSFTVRGNGVETTGSAQGTFVINRKPVNIVGLAVETKVYDKTTDATFTYESIDGAVEGDDLSLEVTGAFEDENAGSDKDVSYSATLKGADKNNYTLNDPTGTLKGTIKPKEATITFQNVSKVYGDEDPDKTEWLTIEGIIDGDPLPPLLLDSLSREPGEDVGSYGYTAAMSSLSNYNFTIKASDAKFSITPRPISAADITVEDQAYSGKPLEPKPTVTFGGQALVEGTDYEVVSYEDNAHVGTATVTVRGKGNFDGETTVAFRITTLKVKVVGIEADDKQYDGTTAATLTFDAAKVVPADDTSEEPTAIQGLTVTAAGTFANAAVGEGKTVTISRIAFAGEGAGNYELVESTTTAKASITKREITFSGITAEDKTYDGTTAATLDTSNLRIEGAVPGERVSVEVTGAFEDPEVGTNKIVKITPQHITGADKANYVLKAGIQRTTRASILAAELPAVTVTGFKALDKVYDGSARAEADPDAQIQVLDAEGNPVEGLTATANLTFVDEAGAADPDAGQGKTVAITSIRLQGEGSDRYRVDLEGSQTATTASIARRKVKASPKEDPYTKTYGDPDPVLEVAFSAVEGADPSGLVEGDTLAYRVFRDAGEGAGDHAVHVTGDAVQGNYEVTFADGTLTIAKRMVTVSGVRAEDKVYDGDNLVRSYDCSGATIEGKVAGDDLSVTARGHFSDKNVGMGKRTRVDEFTLTGAAAANYALAPEGHEDVTYASITARPVTASGITCEDKYYDGTKNATLGTAGATLEGVLEGEDVTLDADAATGAFDTKNAGEGKLVTISGLALAGEDAGNYALAEEGQQETATATVTPKPVEVDGLKANSKPYDGTTDATFDVTDAEIDGTVEGDDVAVERATGKFVDANVGTNKYVSDVVVTLGGADAANYVPTAGPGPYLADITANEATLTVGTYEKTYGEDDPAFSATVVPELEDRLAYTLERDEGTDVGTYAITVKGVAGQSKVVTDESGTSYLEQAGYRVAIVPGTLTINPRAVTVTPRDATKAYGEADPAFEADVEGTLEGDSVTYAVTRADTSEAVGRDELTASGDERQGNYKVTYANDPAHYLTITAKRVVVASGIKAEGKVYDKTADAALDLGDAVVTDGDGNEVTLPAGVTVTATGMFADAGAGLAKAVYVVGLGLEGEGSENFELDAEASQLSTTADIWRRPVTVTVDADQTKTYGDTDPALSATVEQAETDEEGRVTNDSGLVYGDAVHYDLGRDAGEDVGEYALKAAGEPTQPNYDVTFVDGRLTITPKTVTVDGIAAQDKVYDGTTDATLDTAGARVHDPAFDDELTVTATGTFASKDVRRDANGNVITKRVDVAGIALGGPKARNYVVDADASQKTASARITPAPLRVSGIACEDKVYDGTADATLDVGAATLETPFGDDEVTVASATGTFASKDVRRDADDNVITKRVDVTEVTLGGRDAGNYYVEPEEGTQTTASARITPKEVTVSGITAEDKDYDKTTDATLDATGATIDGLVADDEGKVVVVRAEGHFETADPGEGKQVDIDKIVLGPAKGAEGNVSGNYDPKGDDAHTPSATIRPIEVTVTVVPGQSKVYGEQDPDAYAATVAPGLAEGDVTYETTRAEGDDAGTYAITFVNPQAQQCDGKYNVTFVDGTFEITPRPVTVTPKSDLSKTYGEADPDWASPDEVSDVTYTGDETKTALVGEDRLTYTVSREAGEDAGTYDVTAEGAEYQGGASARNYEVTYANPGALTITPREVTVTADNQSKRRGQQDPGLTATVDPDPLPVAGDRIEYELDRVKGEDGRQTYAIFFVSPAEWQSGHEGSDAPNYHVTYADGRLGIDCKPVTITAKDLTKTYGDETPELTATVNGAPAALVEYTVKLDPDDPMNAEDKAEDVGEHRLIVVAVADQGSYKVEVRSGKLTIGPAPVTVRADDAAKAYDNDPANPASYAATVTGLKRGDGEDAIAYEVSREAGEDVGTYAITPTGEAAQGNYEVTYVPGTLAITARTVTVRGFEAADKEYDGTREATVSGGRVYDGDTEVAGVSVDAAKLVGEFEDKNAGDLKTVGISGIGLAGEGAGNYAIDLAGSQTKALASISRRPIEVSAADEAGNTSKTYGDDDPSRLKAQFRYTGTTGPADPAVLDGDGVYYNMWRDVDTRNGKYDPAGEYTIHVDGSELQGNYEVTFKNGTFTVNRRDITLTGGITAADKVYDGTADATLDCDGATFENTVGDDVVRVASARGTFVDASLAPDKSAGENKTVLVDEIELDEGSARNYNLVTESLTTTATISVRPVTITSGIGAEDKVYDTGTEATLGKTATPVTFSERDDEAQTGYIEGDDLDASIDGATAAFEDENVAHDEDGNVTTKRVTASGIALTGADAGNYALAYTDESPFETTATITPADVVASGFEAVDKDYDKGADATLATDGDGHVKATLAPVLGEDEVWVESATALFSDPTAGRGKTVNVSQIRLGGADGGNYRPNDAAVTQGDINPPTRPGTSRSRWSASTGASARPRRPRPTRTRAATTSSTSSARRTSRCTTTT